MRAPHARPNPGSGRGAAAGHLRSCGRRAAAGPTADIVAGRNAQPSTRVKARRTRMYSVRRQGGANRVAERGYRARSVSSRASWAIVRAHREEQGPAQEVGGQLCPVHGPSRAHTERWASVVGGWILGADRRAAGLGCERGRQRRLFSGCSIQFIRWLCGGPAAPSGGETTNLTDSQGTAVRMGRICRTSYA